jgi:DNA-directed RNA polymerase subunit RPC12/RpoP
VLSDAGNRVRECDKEYVFYYNNTNRNDLYCPHCRGKVVLIGRNGKIEQK